jgi:probable HAF family extracellular repeat protein
MYSYCRKLLLVLSECIYLLALIFLAGCGGVSTPPPLQLLAIASSLPPGGAVGGTYGGSINGYTFQASGGVAPYTWSWSAGIQSALPPGLNFTSGGVMSGVPTAPGIYDVIVTVTDSGSHVMQASAEFKIRIATGGVLAIAFAGLPSGTVGTPYGVADHASNDVPYTAFTLGATGGSGDYGWSWAPSQGSSLPPGLALTVLSLTSAGMTRCCVTVQVPVIEGTPSAAGSYNVVVMVTDSENPSAHASGAFKVAINAATAAANAVAAPSSPEQHHHYKLIDLGTLGGPSSYLNAFVDQFSPGMNQFFFSGAQLLSKKGILAGWADTSTSDPSPGSCFNADCFVSHAFQWQEGTVTDLGALASGWSSAATGINETGQIVGLSENGAIDPLIGLPEVRAVLWKDGHIIDLGTQGGNQSAALAVNNRGQIAGLALNAIPDPFSIYDLLNYGSSSGTQTRAVLWDEDRGMQDLGTLGGPDAYAQLVNERGQVAGWSYTNSFPNTNTGLPTFHPFLWEKGKGMQDLGTLGGTVAQAVNGLNERGQVVGATTLAGDVIFHPFLWDGKKLIDLGTFGGDSGEANWVNDEGDVVGGAGTQSVCPGSGRQTLQGFLWRDGVMTNLGTTDGLLNSEANFINSRSQIVGHSFPCGFSFHEAFLWENGSIVNLNTLISPRSAFHLFLPASISNQGEIGVFGLLPNGDQHALLLIPCDEEHTGIEGCDYDPVEAAPAAAVQNSTAPIAPARTAGTQASLTPSEMSDRIRALLSKRNRRFGGFPPK